MLKVIVSVLVGVLLFGVFPSEAQENSGRQRLLIDADWRFHLGDLPANYLSQQPKTIAPANSAAGTQYDDHDWQQVDLPHDWAVEQPFDPKSYTDQGFHPTGIAWYRRTFTLPASDRGRRLTLEFDGIYRDSTVWLNGHYLGTHQSGYTSFAYDITAAARYGGPNVLAVRVDASYNEGWWYEGCGIYRHVWLVQTTPLHVAHWGTYVTSEVSENGPDAYQVANVSLHTTLANETGKQTACRLLSRIVDASGTTVGSVQSNATLAVGQSLEIAQQVHLDHPHLWSLETPDLYRLLTTVEQQGHSVDTYETTFGIRTIRFDKDHGFFLNGKPVKIKGTCNHQDFAGIGVALPDRIHVYKIEKLKAMGSNAYRCAHDPVASELLDVCDRMGMLVMEENRHLGESPEILGQVESMVHRDRNHPSIILWSLFNEEPQQGTPEGARKFQAMKEIVRRLDTTRPVTGAMNADWGKGTSQVQDVQGCNYTPESYDTFHQAFPNQPMLGSETLNLPTTRGIYADDRTRGYVSAYALFDTAWKLVADRDFMAGTFVWAGFDFRGRAIPYGWPCISSHFGIIDTCGFPKDNYYYYLSWWGSRPVIHVMPHWNWSGREGQAIQVRCLSNCERVELFLNGRSLGAKVMPRNGHLDWQVNYTPGRLEAIGYNGGQAVAQDTVETTGPPASLQLSPDRTRILADNEDVSIIAVSVRDSAGRVVPTADNEVTFALSGPGKIIGVGNGDPSSHEPDKASQRHAFNGYSLVIVQAKTQAGDLVLTATSPGLESASVHITMQATRNSMQAFAREKVR
jgi:beta-galactosidase